MPSNPRPNGGWVVELEAGVWLAPWPGDPGRTLVAGSAKRFPTPTAAYRALAAALRYHGFMGAQVMAHGAPSSAPTED